MVDPGLVGLVANDLIPLVDSLGFNEQELVSLIQALKGATSVLTAVN